MLRWLGLPDAPLPITPARPPPDQDDEPAQADPADDHPGDW